MGAWRTFRGWPARSQAILATTAGVVGLFVLGALASPPGPGDGAEPVADGSAAIQTATAAPPLPEPADQEPPAGLSSGPGTASGPPAVPAPSGEVGDVVKIVDGDTIDVSVGGVTSRVRYIGMNTPERGECFFSAATDANRGMVGGRSVRLVADVSDRDRYGRLLRYVYAGDLFVNAELVRTGFANAATYPPDVTHAQTFVELEREARDNNRGLWAPGACAGQTSAPAQTPQQTQNQGGGQNCHASYPDFCVPPPPPDLNCPDMSQKNFTVLHDVADPDPHGFDGNGDGVGCET